MAFTTDRWIGAASADWGASGSNWSAGFPDSKSNVVINTATVLTVSYGGGDDFTVHSLTVGNDVFDMSGGSLTIAAASSFAGGFIQTGGVLTAGAVKIAGAGTLNELIGGEAEGNTKFTVDATLSLGSYTLGGAAVLDNAKTVEMTNGITLGDSTDVGATIDNEKGAVFNIAGDFGINQGASSARFINAGTLEKTAGTGTTSIGVNFSDTGKIIVASAGAIDFTGPENSFAGVISGGGTFEVSGGSNTIARGASISTAGFVILGGTVALDENLSYGHAFTLENSAVLDLAPTVTLTLSGTDALSGATLDGSGTLDTAKSSNITVSSFTLGGSDIWLNSGTVGEVNTLTLGGNSFDAATLINEKGGIYEFASDTGIAIGAAFDSSFVNEGLLEKTAGGNTSAIAAAVTDTGTIKIQSGTIAFEGFDNSFAGSITGAGTFEIAAGDSTIEKGATIRTAVFDIADNGTVVTLGESLSYKGTFNFESAANIDLAGFTLTLTGQDTFNNALFDGTGKLVTAKGSAIALSILTLGGALVWENSGTISEFNTFQIGDTSTDTAHFINEKGGVFNFVADVGIALGAMPNSDFVNSAGATVAKTGGGGDSRISVAFINNGLVKVDTGTIEFTDLVSGSGTFTIDPGAVLQFDVGVAKGSTVDFATTKGGELLLFDSQGFGAKIKGFGGSSTDKIDLRDINFDSGQFRMSYNAKTGALTLFDGSHTATLDFIGKYTTKDFQASTDGSGGTLLVDPGPHALLAFNH